VAEYSDMRRQSFRHRATILEPELDTDWSHPWTGLAWVGKKWTYAQLCLEHFSALDLIDSYTHVMRPIQTVAEDVVILEMEHTAHTV